jgi:hypothetical protein
MALTKKTITATRQKKTVPVSAPATSMAARGATPSVSKRPVKTTTPTAKAGVKAAKPIVQQPKVVSKPKADKPVKAKKPKLVRDSFTIPKDEYAVLETLKQRAGQLSNPAKKSELLRAGIKALAAMPDAALLAALKAVPSIKTGRPAKN